MNNTTDSATIMQRLEQTKAERLQAGLPRRHRREKAFRALGLASVTLGLGFLAALLITIFSQGLTAFYSSYIKLDIHYDAALLQSNSASTSDQLINYQALLDTSLSAALPEAGADIREVRRLVSDSALFQVRDRLAENPRLSGQTEALWVLADDEVDLLLTGLVDRSLPVEARRLSDNQIGWIDQLTEADRLERRFNRSFFTRSDSRDPESAGIWGALVGSFFTLLVTLALAFPIGLATAVYLEEFAPRNRLTDLIELNINNLAAVPSIIFGLLGLAVFINTMGLPRSAPLVGGMVLTLITLPTIIITARSALQAVPTSLRDAAIGMGASKMQVTLHHVLPQAMPGILTGAIIGLAQALGETAPLLMIGMVAFIADAPSSLTDPATVLPVQIFIWSDSPERAFIAKTSAAIMVLLGFLAAMNLTAVLMRRRFEQRLK